LFNYSKIVKFAPDILYAPCNNSPTV